MKLLTKELKKSSRNKSQEKVPNFLDGKNKKKANKAQKKPKPQSKKRKTTSKTKSISFKPGTIISPDGIPIEPPKGSQFDTTTGTYVMPSFLFKLDSGGNPVFATEGLKMDEKGRIVQDKKDKQVSKKKIEKKAKKESPKSKKNKKRNLLPKKNQKESILKKFLKMWKKVLQKERPILIAI